MQKNVAGKWVVFAWTTATNVALTGDASNITANIRIDGGAANAVDDTNPTELEDGYYIFDITATESNGDNLLLAPVSATGGVQVIGVPGAVWTRPPNFQTLGIESDGDLTKCNLVATTTANTDMRGTDSALLAADINLTAGAVDNVTLVATTTANTDMRGTDSAFLAASAPTNFSSLVISAGGAVDSFVNGFLNVAITESIGGLIAANFETFIDNAGGVTTAILDDITDIQTQIGTAGDGLTNINLPNQTMDIVGDITGSLSGSVGSVTAIDTTGGAIDNVILVATTTTNTDAYDPTAQITESYAANSAAPTRDQAMLAIHQMLMSFAIAGTNLTVKKLDNSATAFVVTLDSATNPTGNSRV